ncbi:hypothetical protein ACN9MH_27635 [Paenibacillus silvae]
MHSTVVTTQHGLDASAAATTSMVRMHNVAGTTQHGLDASTAGTTNMV